METSSFQRFALSHFEIEGPGDTNGFPAVQKLANLELIVEPLVDFQVLAIGLRELKTDF